MALQFVPQDNLINQIQSELLSVLVQAQGARFESEFATAAELCQRAFDDLRLALPVPENLRNVTATAFADDRFSGLVQFFRNLLVAQGLSLDTLPHLAVSLAQRVHLLRAFAQPGLAVQGVVAKVEGIVKGFPRSAEDIQRGKNPGDVLDPYILAATQTLLYSGDFEKAVAATVAHKALMMIEGLLGHLHEDIIGQMRGNVRVPEPRAEDQETFDLKNNPFPGADVLQVPLAPDDELSFHQIKSKTGSAKGGDGRRLGLQLQHLRDTYGGGVYYHALIGSTLRGHRSKAGVERAAPEVVVLVGDASFRKLTRTPIGAELLLRVYQAAFTEVQSRQGYDVDTMAAGVVSTFRAKAEQAGETFLEVLLGSATSGEPSEQDSRLFNAQEARESRRRYLHS